jgi:hypothetical protein
MENKQDFYYDLNQNSNPSLNIYYDKYLKYANSKGISLLYDLNQNSNPSLDIYYHKYLKYKAKYIALKKQSNIKSMHGGFDPVSEQITQLNNFIDQINNSVKKSGEKNPELISLCAQLEKYLVDQDIPIDLKFNPYVPSELEESLSQLKLVGTRDNLTKLYEKRNHIYSMDETNYVKILDWIIEKENISHVKDVEKLFSSLILGNNKNYVVYYMVLLRFLITKKVQLSVLESYSPILSWYGLKSCLATGLNSDDYLPLVLNLICEYINAFPIKKTLLIKKPSDFESDWKQKQKLLQLEAEEIPNNQMVNFDTKNKIFQYESGEIKSMDKIDFEDLVKILFNLFRIYIPKIKPETEQKTNNSEEKSTV